MSASALSDAWVKRAAAAAAVRAAIAEADADSGLGLEVLKAALAEGRDAGLEGEVNTHTHANEIEKKSKRGPLAHT